jgi:hypothetical protein
MAFAPMSLNKRWNCHSTVSEELVVSRACVASVLHLTQLPFEILIDPRQRAKQAPPVVSELSHCARPPGTFTASTLLTQLTASKKKTKNKKAGSIHFSRWCWKIEPGSLPNSFDAPNMAMFRQYGEEKKAMSDQMGSLECARRAISVEEVNSIYSRGSCEAESHMSVFECVCTYPSWLSLFSIKKGISETSLNEKLDDPITNLTSGDRALNLQVNLAYPNMMLIVICCFQPTMGYYISRSSDREAIDL